MKYEILTSIQYMCRTTLQPLECVTDIVDKYTYSSSVKPISLHPPISLLSMLPFPQQQ